MTHERPAQGRPSADGFNVGTKSSEGDGHGAGALTVKQRKRWSALTVDGILARPPYTAQAHDLAMSLGKVMRGDGSFDDLRHADDMLCVEVRPSHRDKVRRLLELSPWSWGEYVRRWEDAGLAHKCADLGRGSVRLFLDPASACPVPKCGVLLGATVNRGSEQQSPLPRATETVLTVGDASRDAQGDVSLSVPKVEDPKVPDASQGSLDIAARIRRERELGLADRDIAALLNRSEAFTPPEGFVHWTGYAVRVAVGEATHAA